MRTRYKLFNDLCRKRAHDDIEAAPTGHTFAISPPNRTLDQNAYFHDLCGDIAKSGKQWAGAERDEAAWKVLLISGHTVATGGQAEIIPGLENEFVNIRESSAGMTVERGSSLIEYALAWCADNGVKLPAREGE